ncbi:MAG: peptidoglycan-binding protein, partial [Hyphomicrobiaceae bacterium]
SDYDQYAVDQDGDHKPNPWSSLPDALASAANQLVKNHWKGGRPWGLEVHLPPAFDCTLATADLLKTFTDWGRLGIKGVRGEPLPAKLAREEASLLMPAGTYGPAFLTTGNFLAVKAYNLSDLYALFVTHLADRIAGRGPYVEPWKKVIQLRERDVVFLQNRLTEAGFYSDRVDGKTGSRTRAAVGAWQKANGLPQDCWPTAAMLKHMQAAKRQ